MTDPERKGPLSDAAALDAFADRFDEWDRQTSQQPDRADSKSALPAVTEKIQNLPTAVTASDTSNGDPPGGAAAEPASSEEPEIDATFVFESRCTMCSLPDDVLEIAKAMRFEQGLSSASIAARLNPLLRRRDIPKRVNVRGVSNHFAEHGTDAERIAYRHQSFRSGARELNVSGPPARALAILSDARTQHLQEVVDFVVESNAERLESELLEFESTKLVLGSDCRSRAVSNLNQTNRMLMNAVTLSHRLAGDRAEGAAMTAVLHSFADDAGRLVGEALQAIAESALADVPHEQRDAARARVLPIVSELAKSMRALAKDYEMKLTNDDRKGAS